MYIFILSIQVKRQAVIEIQRAVAAAENRAAEVMAQERLKMEKFFADMSKHATETDVESKSPSLSAGQNVSKANANNNINAVLIMIL